MLSTVVSSICGVLELSIDCDRATAAIVSNAHAIALAPMGPDALRWHDHHRRMWLVV
mgnify:CR=1 FL=1